MRARPTGSAIGPRITRLPTAIAAAASNATASTGNGPAKIAIAASHTASRLAGRFQRSQRCSGHAAARASKASSTCSKKRGNGRASHIRCTTKPTAHAVMPAQSSRAGAWRQTREASGMRGMLGLPPSPSIACTRRMQRCR